MPELAPEADSTAGENQKKKLVELKLAYKTYLYIHYHSITNINLQIDD
jgi:hypothetical protein